MIPLFNATDPQKNYKEELDFVALFISKLIESNKGHDSHVKIRTENCNISKSDKSVSSSIKPMNS